MRITDLLKKDTVIIDLQATEKAAAIDEMTAKLDAAGRLNSLEGYREAILAREAQSTTGIGEGIAIPHAKTDAVKTPSILFAKSKAGVNYESLDGQPAHLLFMIAASAGANNEHLETLSKLSSLLMDGNFRKQLLDAKTAEEVISIIDKKQNEEEGAAEEKVDTSKDEKLVLAVTACPTGIAHTYMAADALKAKAKERGIQIKVETNGSTGVKNALTAEEIEKATAIIVAADKQVEMNRFAGKHVIQVPVAAGIRKTDELLTKAITQDAPVYQATGDSTSSAGSEDGEGGAIKKYFYKPLMNGISNMLPFVVGGGLIVALSFLFGGYERVTPFSQALASIGGDSALGFMVPILAGFIAMAIADRPAFAPGVVGGLLAVSGGAGFLGGLIAGFLAGWVIIGLKKVFSRLPQSLEGIKPVLLYPLFGVLIVGLIMIYVVNTPVAWAMDGLMSWLNGLSGANAVFLGLVVGGMMAIDMGGPFNKTAFAFGIAMAASGNYAPQAAAMVGGMVPPLGIALATTFFKNKFTKAERESGTTNYIMGACFITEGAIPFAAADPLRVIVSCIVGSGIAGALALAFGCISRAPHGGIFVIWAIENPIMFIVALLVGSVVTALLIGFWKKPIQESAEAAVKVK